MHYVKKHHVTILVFDNYQTCLVPLSKLAGRVVATGSRSLTQFIFFFNQEYSKTVETSQKNYDDCFFSFFFFLFLFLGTT